MTNHEKTLFLYTRALDEGDLDVQSKIFEEAAHDPLLFKKLLELDQVHHEEFNMTTIPMTEHPARVLHLHPRRVIYRVAVFLFFLTGLGILFWSNQLPDDSIQTRIISPLTTPEATPTMVPDENRAVISTDNIAHLTQFAQVGVGTINGVLWLRDDEHFLMYGSLGISIYHKSDLTTPVQTIPTDFAIQIATLSPDGEVLATGSFDGVLRGLEIASGTGKIVYEYKIYEQGSYWSMAFDPTGTLIANGNSGEGVQVVDLTKGRQIWIDPYLSSTQSLQFSPEGSVLAISDGESIHLIDIHGDEKVATLALNNLWITAMVFSPGSERLYASFHDGKIYYWELKPLDRTGKTGGSLGTQGVVTHLVHNSNGIWGLRSNSNTPLFALSTENLQVNEMPPIPNEHLFPSLQWYLDVNPLNEAIFYTTSDIYIYDLMQGEVLASTPVTENSEFWSMQVSQQGDIFFYNATNVYQLNPDTLAFTSFLDDYAYIRSIATVPNHPWIAINRDDEDYSYARMELWDIEKHEIVQTIDQRTFTDHLLFTNDGKALISTNYMDALALFEIETRDMTEIMRNEYQRDLVGNPTQPIAAFMSYNSRFIQLYDYAEKTGLPDLQGHALPVWAIGFSPDGTILASTDEENTILWDTTIWEEIAYIPGIGGDELAFSPDGSLLVVVQENNIQILDMQTWQVIAEFPAHRSAMSGIGFTPDGKLLITASFDGTVLLWGVPVE